MKKVLCLFLAVMLSVQIFAFGSVSTAAKDNPTFKISTVDAQKGATVDVNISVLNNPGISSVRLLVSFDSGLTLKNVTYNSEFGGQTVAPSKMSSPVTVLWIDALNNCNKNGTLATLKFEVSDKAAVNSKLNVTMTYDEDDVYNLAEENIFFDVVNGGVNVKGDVASCSHNHKVAIDAKDASCTEQGWDTYYICEDCGQLFASDGTTEIAVRPFRGLKPHSGGKATCTQKAVCTVCGMPYGDFGSHSYTAKTKNEKTVKVKTADLKNCEFYYSCSVCGICENNPAHTFFADFSSKKPGTLYLDKKPSKISYELNEAFDPTGAVLRVKYNDGTIKSLSSSDVQIVGFDTTTGGNKKVHFSYTENGVTLNTWEFTILVDRQVTAIFIPHKPNKTHYIMGEPFEREGMQIIATYSDGTKADVTAEVRTSGYDSLTFGLKKMTVSYTYKGKTVTLQFSYEMNPKLTGLVLTHKPNKLGTYKVREPLSKEGMIITAKFSDGSTKDVTHLIRTSGYSSKQVGKQIITVSYTYGTQTKSVQFSIIMSQT